MPRIRTIKPEFWTDEKLSLLDPLTRLTFLGLISMADDAGRLIDNVKLLDGMLFPNTDDSCREPLEVLARLSRVSRYRSASGQELIQIINWSEHQKVDKASKYVLPGPETAVVAQAAVPSALNGGSHKDSRADRETVARPSRSDLRPSTLDRGPTTVDQGPATASARDDREPAVRLAAAANLGVSERFGEQPNPIRHDAGHSLHAAELIQAAGVPIDFACDAIYTCAKEPRNDPPRTLKFFTNYVIDRWKASEAYSEAKQSTAKDLPAQNGSGRGRDEGVSFVDVVKRMAERGHG